MVKEQKNRIKSISVPGLGSSGGGTELESQRKQNERDNDALRIKVKVIDDQTETISKLRGWRHCRGTMRL
ncbi:hypothetical protein J4Q44_G00268660 [Coregonus suidteri]|uniref:Uncharacterized protein n=1 Tax=Coregonus suidteri TaxID=861788 RepID=A0AAN8QKT1_9TELE